MCFMLLESSTTIHSTLSMLLNSWNKHILTFKNGSSIQKARKLNRTHCFLPELMFLNQFMISRGFKIADSLLLWPSKKSHQSIRFSGRNPPPTTLWCWGGKVWESHPVSANNRTTCFLLLESSNTIHSTLSMLLNSWNKHLFTLKTGSSCQKSLVLATMYVVQCVYDQ